MEYRLLGRTGVRVAPLAIGTMNFGAPTSEEESARILDRALDAGLNLIDTANSYNAGESEAVIGRALRASGRRHEVVLATKAHFPTGPGPNERGNSRLHLVRACEDSLRRLQTDHIDLYQIHRPDPSLPVEETLGALTDLVRQGKVRYVGCSTHPAWRVMEALAASERGGLARYCSEQPPYNLLDRRVENELIPLCQAHGLAVLPWSPLAQGVLAGRYDDAHAVPADSRAALRGGIYAERVTGEAIAVGRRFVALAEERGAPPAQLALAWLMAQPGVTAPIFGPRTLAQLEHALPALELRVDEGLLAACDALVPPGSAVVNFHNTAGWMRQRLAW
ncbi:MAG TPA: aldo/keto reductase [Chloroflexaceae bacterium]|nr:aldo/keto reductase [Chloroflexaceae bacterium]